MRRFTHDARYLRDAIDEFSARVQLREYAKTLGLSGLTLQRKVGADASSSGGAGGGVPDPSSLNITTATELLLEVRAVWTRSMQRGICQLVRLPFGHS